MPNQQTGKSPSPNLRATGKLFSGLSLRTKLIIGNLAITIIVIIILGSFMYYRSSQSNKYLSDQYQSSVILQIESNLADIVEREALTQNDFFSAIKKNISQIGKTTEILFNQERILGSGSYWDASESLTRLDQGSWDNANSEVSSIFIPSFTPINEKLFSELNALKLLDYSIPTILQENSEIVAIYFGGINGETIYNPNIDLAGIVPHDFNVVTRPWFIAANPEKNPSRASVWSTPYLDAALNGLVITCSLPVYDGLDNFRGVVAIDVKLNNIANMASKIHVGQSGYAVIIDKQGQIIAMPPEGYADFGFSPEEITSGETITQSILEIVSIDLFPPFAEMASGRNDIRILSIDTIDYYLAHHFIPSVGYSLGVLVPAAEMQTLFIQTNEVLARQNQQTIINVAIVILTVLILSLIATIFMGNQLTVPLVRLTETANKIAEGDLTAQAQISTQDEIGVLSETINSMTNTLQGMITSLEERVEERTVDLSRRAAQLEAIAEVARDITSIQDVNSLLPAIAQLISRKFGFYHSGVFLSDAINKNQILKAVSSEGGELMLKRGHKLPMDEHSIVGYTAFLGEPRIALDVGADRVFFNNPDLPDTRSEMALPLKIGKEVIGVLDVQSEKTGAFLADDINTLGILADQIAIAIQNTRLLADSKLSLIESKESFRRYISNEWKDYPDQVKNIGYTFDQDHVSPLSRLDIQNHKDDGRSEEDNNTGMENNKPLSKASFPIQLQDQVIGIIEVQPSDIEREWTVEEQNLIKAVSERAAIALENARLLDITLKKASKEQAITEITTKIGTAFDFQNILKIAVEELGRTISDSAISIYLQGDE